MENIYGKFQTDCLRKNRWSRKKWRQLFRHKRNKCRFNWLAQNSLHLFCLGQRITRYDISWLQLRSQQLLVNCLSNVFFSSHNTVTYGSHPWSAHKDSALLFSLGYTSLTRLTDKLPASHSNLLVVAFFSNNLWSHYIY